MVERCCRISSESRTVDRGPDGFSAAGELLDRIDDEPIEVLARPASRMGTGRVRPAGVQTAAAQGRCHRSSAAESRQDQSAQRLHPCCGGRMLQASRRSRQQGQEDARHWWDTGWISSTHAVRDARRVWGAGVRRRCSDSGGNRMCGGRRTKTLRRPSRCLRPDGASSKGKGCPRCRAVSTRPDGNLAHAVDVVVERFQGRRLQHRSRGPRGWSPQEYRPTGRAARVLPSGRGQNEGILPAAIEGKPRRCGRVGSPSAARKHRHRRPERGARGIKSFSCHLCSASGREGCNRGQKEQEKPGGLA